MARTLPDLALFYLPGVFQRYLNSSNHALSSAVMSCSVLAAYCERPRLVICEIAFPFPA